MTIPLRSRVFLHSGYSFSISTYFQPWILLDLIRAANFGSRCISSGTLFSTDLISQISATKICLKFDPRSYGRINLRALTRVNYSRLYYPSLHFFYFLWIYERLLISYCKLFHERIRCFSLFRKKLRVIVGSRYCEVGPDAITHSSRAVLAFGTRSR